ncbi:High-affinity Na(+)/H(+) antiporter NhaS3 [Anatilimnocola aggregata]|uniref:High-affinity Na(+)/H(+) antiporter NhaS3 n=1 Tax=Anatilimnocola aggregata TaxID=2528021 RepID=A0A517YM40_9BACT|nr:cation:proton antiporter [Anatilimnocola aggregata]QDU31289.1 High-affinity Na(+)/H(+) antiporter NhaS3 [Anatilimnocola aggregata]
MICLPILAAGDAKTETLLLRVLLQLAVIIAASQVGARVAKWCRQPAVVGEIAAGLLLGPSLFGWLFPTVTGWIFAPETASVMQILSQLGLILLLFLVGLEFDFGHLRWHGSAAIATSLTGVILPFALGAGLAPLIYPYVYQDGGHPVSFAGFLLFMGVSMSITAIPVLARILLELNIVRTRIGAVTMTAAAVDDVIGWILLAAVSSIVQAQFNAWRLLQMTLLTVAFLAIVTFIIRPVMKWLLRRCYVGEDQSDLTPGGLALVLVALFACGIATSLIGIFAIFGAFLLGAALSDEEPLRKALGRELRDFLSVFFLPIFFTYTGLHTNIGSLETVTHWLILAAVMTAAISGKWGGCTFAAWLGGFKLREAACIGALMNTRGLMGLMVINVGRELGVIPESIFCILVLVALLTTLMTTPLLLWLAPGTELQPFVAKSELGGSDRA